MKREWVKTNDGSPSLFVPELKQNYHSQHGALQESRHVFIEAGLKQFSNKEEIHILEIGFGTGINALLSHFEKDHPEQKITYQSLEKYPLSEAEWKAISWPELFKEHKPYESFYRQLHQANWEQEIEMHPKFKLLKNKIDLKIFDAPENSFDLIYYDAFSPEAQPDLWTEMVFEKMHKTLKPGGLLVTYCVKGIVRRAMKAAHLKLEKIPGPPGKREMLRATKD